MSTKKSPKREKTDPSRRDALRMMLGGTAFLGLTPAQVLLSSLVDGIISDARAQETGAKSKRLVTILMGGGPCRWGFDLPLHPLSPKLDSSLSVPPAVSTRFKNGQAVYELEPFVGNSGKTIYMPPLWNTKVPTGSGGTAPLSNLLKSCLILRGIRMPSDGHGFNITHQFQPNAAGPSLLGLAADAATTEPLPAIGVNGAAPFRSLRGISMETIAPNPFVFDINLVKATLSPYSRTEATVDNAQLNTLLARRKALESYIESALQVLGKRSQNENPASSAIWNANSRAESILRDGLPDLIAGWNEAKLRYIKIAEFCGANKIPGITDQDAKPVDKFCQIRDGVQLAPTLSQVHAVDSRVWGLAENMALVEVLLTSGMSRAIHLNIAAVMIPSLKVSHNFDEHGTGSHLSVVLNGILFQNLGAMLLELSTVLEKKGLYSDTVFQLFGDFPRQTRAPSETQLAGSDHGWKGNVTTLFGGGIDGLHILGSIAPEGAAGLWGAGARPKGAKDFIGPGHVASSIAQVLNVKSPTPNFPPVLTCSEGKLSYDDSMQPSEVPDEVI